MPFFDQPLTPAMPGRPPYKNEVVQRWTAAIAQSDGFVFVTPEYNYGPSAVLKNAIDWVYPEWNRKAAGFVSYGSAMGARSVQQLRQTAIEVQLPRSRSSVHIPVATLWAHYQGGDVEGWTGRAGGARHGDDRRSAVVDCGLEDGARQRVLTGHCATTPHRARCSRSPARPSVCEPRPPFGRAGHRSDPPGAPATMLPSSLT